MSSGEAKCRKCRASIISGKYVLSLQDYVEESEAAQSHECQDNVWFIPIEAAPDSIRSNIEKSSYTKGKVLCHQCGSKLGGFDFVSGTKCECSRVALPPLWINRNKVDIAMALPSHIEARLQEYRQTQQMPPIDNFPEPTHIHDDHMFDTKCKRCRYEFVMSEKNYEFRGPVSHGDHVFDTSCDICRAVFLADHIEHEFEFQVQSELPTELVREIEDSKKDSKKNSKKENEAKNNSTNSTQNEASTDCDVSEDITQQATVENDLNDENANADARTERGGGDADNLPEPDDAECENPFNALALPEPEEAEDKQEDGAAATGAGHEEPESLVCPVCLELLYLPHWCTPCEHVFCAPCLRRLRAISPASNTRCPLCRNVIVKCLPQHEMCRTIKSQYPEEHRKRRQIEKRNRRQPQLPLPGAPAPGTLSSFLAQRHNRNRGGGGGSQVLAAGAGVCFVVLFMMLGFTVFATTVGFLLWYMVEVSMDIVCDVGQEVSTLFELGYQALVLMCIEGRVPTDLARLMSVSAGRMIQAFTKLVNRTRGPESEDPGATDLPEPIESAESANVNGTSSGTQFLTRMAQAQMANYVLVGFLVTYLLYRFAKHVQQARARPVVEAP